MKDLRSFVHGLTKGTFGVTITTETEPRMRKTNNPYFGRVKKVTRLTNVALGYGYENVVNARLEREGKSADFEADKPKGKSWELYPLFLCSDKDETQKYLRTTMRKNTATKSVLTLDGEVVTDADTIAHIKSFIQSSAKPTNQGLEDENVVIVRDYKVQGIVSIEQGEKMWRRDAK